ncbi:hypothetical protein RZS08_57055, partial [Arthrospira platensis SPKY1]|nr:hypothetical protein [Arthrospira platensis SPKY1]
SAGSIVGERSSGRAFASLCRPQTQKTLHRPCERPGGLRAVDRDHLVLCPFAVGGSQYLGHPVAKAAEHGKTGALLLTVAALGVEPEAFIQHIDEAVPVVS